MITAAAAVTEHHLGKEHESHLSLVVVDVTE